MFSYNPETKILSGTDFPDFFHPNVTLGQIILHYLRRDPLRIVQVCYDDGVELTAAEMVKLSSRAARNLMKNGIKYGDVIGLVAKNTTYVTPIVLACILIGAPINTLDPSFDSHEIAHIFRQTKPKLVFCDHDNLTTVKMALDEAENEADFITLTEEIFDVRHVMEFFQQMENEREFMAMGFGDLASKICAVILCSSGTTGLSKGVCISHAQCQQMLRSPGSLLNPTVLCFSSLYWLSGFSILMYSMGNCAKRVISKRPFSPIFMIHLIELYKVTVILSPPSQVALIVRSPALKLADLSSVRLYMVGGGYLVDHLRKFLQDHLLYGALVVAYGMTEIAGVVSTTVPFQKISDSVGKISINTKIKIVDEDGNTLEPNEIGEIFVKTQNKFLGYCNNLEDTQNALDAHGWLHSGDLGYFTEEGEIYVVDRKKDMIKYLNYQVSPAEIESFISTIDGVKAVCVVGIPDIISGDLAAAIIIKDKTSMLLEGDIINQVSRHFPIFKRLHGGAYFIAELPMTPSGKVKKRIVKQMAIKMYKSNEINGNYERF